MFNNKWVILILTIAVIIGLLIVLNAHFGLSLGMGSKTFTVGVQ